MDIYCLFSPFVVDETLNLSTIVRAASVPVGTEAKLLVIEA